MKEILKSIAFAVAIFVIMVALTAVIDYGGRYVEHSVPFG